MPGHILRYKIMSVTPDGAGVKRFVLSPSGQGMGRFRAGQFVFLHFLDQEGRSLIKRAYSIASAPEDEDLEFAIGMVGGAFTSKLDAAKPGDVLGLEGPLGRMMLDEHRDAAFICGGTGIAPAMSMMRHIVKSGEGRRFTLFYSARSRDRILFSKELDEMASHPGMKVVITLTRERPEGWEGEIGRLCHEMIGRHIQDAGSRHWYVCGPMAMIRGMLGCLGKMGLERKSIEVEGWG